MRTVCLALLKGLVMVRCLFFDTLPLNSINVFSVNDEEFPF